MELLSMTIDPQTSLASFIFMGAGPGHQYTMKLLPGETLASAAVRVDDLLRQLKQGTLKPRNLTF